MPSSGIAERLAGSHERQDLFRTIVDETLRALRVDHVTIRLVHDDRLEVVAWAGLEDDDRRGPCRRSASTRRWAAQVLREGRVLAWSDARLDPLHATDRYPVPFAGDLVAPLIHHDEVIGVLSAVTREPRAWTPADEAFIGSLARHAGIALTNAELFARTETRAAQLAALQAASGRLSRASSVEGVGRIVVEEARRVIDYHNARVYLVELPDQVVPDRLRGPGRRLRARRHGPAPLPPRARASAAGSPSTASRSSPTTPTPTRVARPSSGPTTSTSR